MVPNLHTRQCPKCGVRGRHICCGGTPVEKSGTPPPRTPEENKRLTDLMWKAWGIAPKRD